jgi:predicted DNA-binding transcriptional regulator AlpA
MNNTSTTQSATPPSLWDVQQVADYFGVTPRTIWSWAESEGFPQPVRVGRRYVRWYAPEVVKFLESQRQNGEKE